MITILIVLLSLCVIFLAREIIKLKKAHTDFAIKHYTDFATLTHNYGKGDEEIIREHGSDLDKIHTMILELQIHIETEFEGKLDELEKKIPITNDTLLKEIQQMRDDFFALRQNL